MSLGALAQTSAIEGVIRSVDPDELRIVIETVGSEIVVAWGSDDTLVRFEGSTYRIRNLEVGDRVRMNVSGEGDERRVDAIDVLESVSPSNRLTPRPAQDESADPEPAVVEQDLTLTSVTGKVDQTRPDRNLIRIIAEGGLSWVRIDATTARTPDGAPFEVSGLLFGETIEAVGRIGNNGELVATVIRRESEIEAGTPAPAMIPVDEPAPETTAATDIYRPREIKWLDVVEFAGEIVSPLEGGQTLTIRNEVTKGEEIVWCDSSLVVTYDGDPMPASDLETGMLVEVRALRVTEGLIVQSIEAEEGD
jgi:hypothetical protein